MKKKVCKRCKIVVDEDKCSICHGTSFSQTWQGRLFVLEPGKSEIAKKVGIGQKGEYAIKVR